MGRVHRNRSNLFQSVGIKGSKEVWLINWSRTGSHCTTRNLSLPENLEGRGNRPPEIGHHSWPAGAFPSLSQAWLAKYDSHWPPAQPRSTGIHLHSPFFFSSTGRLAEVEFLPYWESIWLCSSLWFYFSIAKNFSFRSARGQCTRAHAQIGAFFSLACAFVPHSFK